MKIALVAVCFTVLGLVASVESSRSERGIFDFLDVLNPKNWKIGDWIKTVGKGFKYATIYPGTKWCGKGNVAKNNNDLGSHKRLDTCCRSHDLCSIKVKSGQTKYGIKNTSIMTWSHCDCDSTFRSCLKKVDSTNADVVGVSYFDVINNKCIYQAYPRKCKKILWIKIKCTTDKSNGKIWMSKNIGSSYLF